MLEHTGLVRYLYGWCISEEVDVRKPDPGIFALAAELCGSDLTAVWMCGDSPMPTSSAPGRAGLYTIWIRHGRTWPAFMPQPGRTVDSITEALQALLRLCSPVSSG